MSNLTHSLAKNTAIQVAGKALGTVMSLVTFAILLRHLEVDGFGELTIALNYGAMFGILVDFGITLTATAMISEPDANEERIIGNLFSLRVLSALLFMGIGAAAVFLFPYAAEIKVAAVLACVSFFFGSVSSMFIGIFQKRLTLMRAVLAESLNRLAVVAAALLITLLSPSIIAASAIFILGSVVQFVVTLVSAQRHIRIRPQVSFAIWKEILTRSWPIGVSIAFNLVYLKGDIFFMSLYHVGAHAIGLYGASYKVVDVVTTVPVMFMGLLLPMLTHAWAEKNRTAFAEYLQRGFDAFAFLAFPFAAGATLTGGALLALIRPDLQEAGPILGILGIAAAAVFFGSLFGHTIVALRKQRPMLMGYAVVAVLSTAGYMMCIPRFGVLAAAWVTLASETLITLIAAVVVLRVSQTRLNLRMALRAIAASMVMVAVLVAAPHMHVLATIALGILTYTAALWAIGGPSPKKLYRLVAPSVV